ncbi:hypothetical protein D3C80_2105590 [compost metagenome]
MGGVVEHQVELAYSLDSGLMGVLREPELGLHMQNDHAQQHGNQAGQHGDDSANGGFSAGLEGQWHG